MLCIYRQSYKNFTVQNKFYNQTLYFKTLSLVNIQSDESFDYQKNSLRIGEMKDEVS